jgi:hypothetical protein
VMDVSQFRKGLASWSVSSWFNNSFLALRG